MVRRFLLSILIVTILTTISVWAQATRPVGLSWTASTSSGITGYNVLRSASTSGPFTTINASLVTGTAYTDTSAVVGSTYTYEVVAVAAACTPTTPVGSTCGSSAPSAPATTTVPVQPNVTLIVTVIVQ